MPACRRRLAFALLASCCLAAPAARADDFSDFRIPAHRVLASNASLEVRANGWRDGTGAGWTHESRGAAQLRTDGLWWSESDGATSQVGWSAYANGTRDRLRGGGRNVYGSLNPLRALQADAGEDVQLSVTHMRWLGAAPFGLGAHAYTDVTARQDWGSRASHDENVYDTRYVTDSQVDEATHESRRTATGGVDAAVGRVRDATGVADALLFERRLLRSGALVRPLSRDARRRLAELAFVQDDLARVHDRPARYVWLAIEQVLRDDGALRGDSLAAVDVARALEPWHGRGGPDDGMPRSPVLRYTGWSAGVTVEGSTDWRHLRASGHSWTRSTVADTLYSLYDFRTETDVRSSADRVEGGVSLEFHRPLGSTWQFDVSGVGRRPLRDAGESFTLASDASMYGIVADRWVGGVRLQQYRLVDDRPEEALRLDYWQAAASAELGWYVEDRVLLRLTGVCTQAGGRQPYAYPPVRRWSRNLGLTLGVSYRLAARAFAAPFAPAGSR